MSELVDEPPPARRRAPRRGKRPRFVMPTEHHDERVGEVIEAFLDGPPVSARPAPRPPRPRGLIRSVRKPIPLDTRLDWDAALRHEDARMARYARPASVLVVRVEVARPTSLDRIGARVGDIVREHARETDRVTRATADRFHLMLPETHQAEAEVLADRIRADCLERVTGPAGIALEVVVVPASPGHGETLRDALLAAVDAAGG